MKNFFVILIIISLFIFGLFFFLQIDKDRNFSVIVFNIGQGDSALINFGEGKQMLVDCGKDKKVLAKLGKYLPFWDRTIEYLVITHFDLDHYGGCIDVLKRYDVKNIITNGLPGTDGYYETFVRIKNEELRMKNKIVNEYEKIEIASSTLEFLWPLENTSFDDKNNNSIVFKLTHPNTTVLFTGDIEEKAEEVLLKEYQDNSLILKSYNLKVSHHGSGGGSSEGFLKAVSPQKAIISVGENNFGHPSLRVLSKLKRVGAEILRTDRMGDVVVN